MIGGKRLMQSYVFRDEGSFFVSTINRQSSAAAAPDLVYAETIAWRLNDDGSRGEQVAMASDGRDSLSKHFEVCARLFLAGEWDDK